MMGIIRRLYMIPMDSNIYADLQRVEPITSFKSSLPKDFTALPDEYILTDDMLEKVILDSTFLRTKVYYEGRKFEGRDFDKKKSGQD